MRSAGLARDRRRGGRLTPGVTGGSWCARRRARCSASRFPSLNSPSALRSPSGDKPLAIDSCHGPRCREISSTICALRGGGEATTIARNSGPSRGSPVRAVLSAPGAVLRMALAAVAWQGQACSRDAPHGFDECGPRLPLLREHAPPFGGHLVEPAAPLVRLLHPGSLDPSALLEAVEQRIERIDMERELPA